MVGKTVLTWLGLATVVVVPLLILAGVILFTRQEPRVALTGSRTAWRPLCQWSGILVLAVVFVYGMIETFLLPGSSVNSRMLLGWAASLIWVAILGTFVICFSRYSAQLVLRLPDPKLAKKIRSRGSGFVGCYAVAEILGVIIFALIVRGGPATGPTALAWSGIAMWGSIAVSVAWLGVLANAVGIMAAIGKLRRELKKSVAESAEHRESKN